MLPHHNHLSPGIFSAFYYEKLTDAEKSRDSRYTPIYLLLKFCSHHDNSLITYLSVSVEPMQTSVYPPGDLKKKNVGPYTQACFIRIIEGGAETILKALQMILVEPLIWPKYPFLLVRKMRSREIAFLKFPLVVASGRAGIRTQVVTCFCRTHFLRFWLVSAQPHQLFLRSNYYSCPSPPSRYQFAEPLLILGSCREDFIFSLVAIFKYYQNKRA